VEASAWSQRAMRIGQDVIPGISTMRRAGCVAP